MIELPPFYVVWCPEHGSPTVRHTSYAEAEREARRLAGKEPGRTFIILVSVASAQRAEPVTVTRFRDPDDDIPF